MASRLPRPIPWWSSARASRLTSAANALHVRNRQDPGVSATPNAASVGVCAHRYASSRGIVSGRTANPMSARAACSGGRWVVSTAWQRDAQFALLEAKPAQLFAGLPSQQYPATDHEIDERRHEPPVEEVRLAAADQGGELGSIGVVAEVPEVRVHEEPVHRVVAVHGACVRLASHQPEFVYAPHDLLLVVLPRVKGREIARELGSRRIAMWIPEPRKLGFGELARGSQPGRRPVGLADQLPGELVRHPLRFGLAGRVARQYQWNPALRRDGERIAFE